MGKSAQKASRIEEVELLETLSHELRSPLASALLCTQMLRRGILDEERSRQALETIERSIGLAVRVVDDLLDRRASPRPRRRP